MCPSLHVLSSNPSCIRTAEESLLHIVSRYAPVGEPVQSGSFVMDLTGTGQRPWTSDVLGHLDVFMPHHLLHHSKGACWPALACPRSIAVRKRGTAGASHSGALKCLRNPPAHFACGNRSLLLVIEHCEEGRIGWKLPIRKSPPEVGLQLLFHTPHEEGRFILLFAFTV